MQAAVDEAVPASVLTAALYARFRSRQEHTFADKMLSAMRQKFHPAFPALWCAGYRRCREQEYGKWDPDVKCPFRAADHHAVSALQAPHAAAGAHVHIVDAAFF